MLPGSITQQPHMPLYVSNNEDNNQTGSSEKKTLQLLKISIDNEHSQPNASEILYSLSAAQKVDYINDLHDIYLSFSFEPSTGIEGPDITLSNKLVFHIEKNGDGIVLTIGGEIGIIENIKFESIPTMIEGFIFRNIEYFKGTDLYDTILDIYIENKHIELDILAHAHSQIKQPCFLVSEYLRSEAADPKDFVLPSALEDIAKRDLQIDFGCLFSSGQSDEIFIGNIKVERCTSEKNKTSLLIRASERLLNENVENLRDLIVNTYPLGCILKTGGGVGHFNYYDVQKDILFSGGKTAYDKKMSGIRLRDYFVEKLNSNNVERKETLTLTDHSAQEMLEVSNLVAEELGVKYEKFF